MAAGFSRMNDLTVLQASQGLATYVKKNIQNALARGIVVGHDHRHHSARFAELTQLAFVQLGFKVYNLGLCHTPLVPFGVDHYNACVGVMVTASHSPARDNGYKVYLADGRPACQIIPPHDSGIAASIEQNLKPWTWDLAVLESDLIVDANTETANAYFATLRERLHWTQPAAGLSLTYTPIHGVGLDPFLRAARDLGIDESSIVVVPEHRELDPDFKTVPFPNPEEQGALDLAIATANKHGCDYVLSNDPDADRFALVVKDPTTNKFVQLTGNQLGLLFASYVHGASSSSSSSTSTKQAMLNSTVSSQALRGVCEKWGVHYEDTLTGFKWIGNRAIDLEANGYRVPFAYEEAIGYMFEVVHDKDGVSAAVVALQMIAEWQRRGTHALAELERLYSEVGYYVEANSYYVTPDPSVTDRVFSLIRQSATPHPATIGRYQVTSWRDLTVGYDSATADHVPTLHVSPSSQMITVQLADPAAEGVRVRFTARGSGTEPKLKVYIEAHAASHAVAARTARDVWDVLRVEWFRPAEFNLKEVSPP